MTFSWIDILIVVILLGFMIEGAFRGFVKGVLSLFTLIASIISAQLFSGEIGQWIETITPIGDSVRETLAFDIAPGIVNSGGIDKWLASNNLNKVPEFVVNFLNDTWESAAQIGGDFADVFADKTTEIIMNMIAFVVILLVCFILFTILVELLDMVAKLPIIGAFNAVGGLFFGLVKALILNIVIVSVLFVIALYFGNESIAAALNSSILAQYFYIGYLLF